MQKLLGQVKGPAKKVDVYKTLKNAIQFLELEPGSVINEANLAMELGVSRTPVREALLRLADELLVEIYPQRGTYIAKIDLFLAKEMAYMRHIVEERVCVGLCEMKADIGSAIAESMFFMKQAVEKDDVVNYIVNDDKFHRDVFKFAKHEPIWDIISNTRTHYMRLLMLDMGFPKTLDESYQQHEDIAKYIREGDVENLRQLLIIHHDHDYMKREFQIKEKYREYFV